MMMSTRAPGFGGNELIGFKDTEKSSSRCRRMKRTMGADKTTVRVVIPRSCLGDPRWFRFSISLSTFNMFAESSYDDDGLATSSTLFGKSAMSPKVRR